jgi:polyisoprenoid-binding protein YceI
LRQIAAILCLALVAGCTALKVVTHGTDADPQAAPAGHYHLDPHHWSVVFDVDHLGYSRFTLRFDRVAADLDYDPADPEQSRVSVVIAAASIDSNDAELDALLRGDKMLESERYPEIRFTSRSLRRTGKSSGEITGDLTIHGETHAVTLAVAFNGGGANPLTGEETLGFSAIGSVDRSKFGLNTWYPAVGKDLELRIEAEFVK